MHQSSELFKKYLNLEKLQRKTRGKQVLSRFYAGNDKNLFLLYHSNGVVRNFSGI